MAGSKLKEPGTKYWDKNTDGNNLIAFSALGSGYRSPYNGFFNNYKTGAFYWSSTVSGSNYYYWGLFDSDANLYPASNVIINFGAAIRCVKD